MVKRSLLKGEGKTAKRGIRTVRYEDACPSTVGTAGAVGTGVAEAGEEAGVARPSAALRLT